MKKVFLLFLFSTTISHAMADWTDYVNPLIGTDNHGHVFVGASVPFGGVQVGPNEMGEGWDWCSGYNYPDTNIKGFSMTHLSGCGCADLGDICLMPAIGTVRLQRGEASDQSTGFFSSFTHDKETARPDYYAVYLERYGIQVELTATERASLQRYTFPASKQAKIIVDLENGISDRPYSCGVRKVNATTITGFRISRGWAGKQYCYFAAVFSKPMSDWKVSVNDSVLKNRDEVVSPHAYGQACFTTTDGEIIQVKVAISGVSEENALMNLNKELSTWNFEEIRRSAQSKWEKELGRVKATFNSSRERTAFYTALYHTMHAPHLYCDVNGDYRGSDGNIYRKSSHTNYTTWSTWDTYRAYHPLATIIYADKQDDWAQSILRVNREQGFMPIWQFVGNETGTMVGISSVPILADMCLKGFVKDADLMEAYLAMHKTMNRPFRDIDTFNIYGYVPYSHASEDVSKSLEYALDDWSVAQVALKLGRRADYDRYMELSRAYQKLYDPQTGFIRPKDNKGVFQSAEGFQPNIQTRSYTEGNPWQYLFLVPHDIAGLCRVMGGKAVLEEKLDSLFATDSDLGDNYAIDIAGLIGQYAHGNEPSHHIAYMYNYIGKPWKGARRLREIMGTMYGDDHMGLPGNEDEGQMSAWYVLSALGLYQVEPCGGRYNIGSPVVNEAALDVSEGKTFKIVAHNNSDRNIYVQKVKLNGQVWTKSYIDYADIMKGGTLELFMGPKPSKFGTKEQDTAFGVFNPGAAK